MTGFTLPGMIELPFWSSGRRDLREAGARARAHEPEVVRDLRQRDRDGLERARGLDERVAGGLRLEGVGRAPRSSRPVSRRELVAHARGELGVRVQAGADRGAAERDLADAAERCLDPRDPLAHLRRVAAELLAEGDRHGVHQVRAAGLDDVVELLGLRLERRRRAGRAPGAGRSSARRARRGARRRGRRRSTTGRCSRRRSGARPRRRARRSPRSRSCSWTCPSRSGRRRSGTGRRTRRPRCGRRRRRSGRPCSLSSRPRSAFTRAAAALMRPSQRATGGRHRLAGDGEVFDSLAGFRAPELFLAGDAAHFRRVYLRDDAQPAALERALAEAFSYRL